MPWHEVVDLLLRYTQFEVRGDKGKYYPNRIKQWFAYLRHAYPQANELFGELRTLTQVEPIVDQLHRYRDQLHHAAAKLPV